MIESGGLPRDNQVGVMTYQEPDLTEAILRLLMRIDEGREKIKADGGILEEFQNCAARQSEAYESWKKSTLVAIPQENSARREYEKERDRLRAEYDRLDGESRRLFQKLGEVVAFMAPFADDVLAFAERLPLMPRWNAFRKEIQRLGLNTIFAWQDPPANPHLGILEQRLHEMLCLVEDRSPLHGHPTVAASPAKIEAHRKSPSELLTTYKVRRRIRTHEDVAEELDLERSVYFALKAGNRVSEETYVKAALKLGCSPDDLKPISTD